MSVFKDTFRIESARHPDWNYADNGMYFVTICTQNKVCYFGEVINEKMRLNDIGQIVVEELLKTPQIRKNVILDEWIIMPNHLHVIIFICNNGVETSRRDVSTKAHNNFQLQSGSLGAIINQIKSICTKRIRLVEPKFSWQSRFYDRIIRNEYELRRIRDYVYYNAAKWDIDKNNSDNLFC